MAWPMSIVIGNTTSESKVKSASNNLDARTTSPYSSPLPIRDLLRQFELPGVPPPPSSRVGDPRLKQKERKSFKLWHLWRYGAFAALKASEVFSAVVSHHIRGPPRKSWGIEMTLLTSIMRDVSSHSHLADIAMIRMIMGISGLVPVPSDALVTPVTSRVPKRGLRGILAEFDALEDGSRELSGEWVVGKRTWQRLQDEWQRSRKVNGELSRPSRCSKRKERVILYLHGGAYYLSSPATHRLITIPLSKSLDARLFAVDYRLAPETRFPGSLHDAVTAYFRLIDDLHISPEHIIIAGDSAGGGLSVALLMYLRDNHYPLPGGAILMSPWVDLTMSCDSWESNAQYDVVPKPLPGDHLNPIACYLGEHMEKYLTHPYASPLFGDFKGLPPLLIQSGDCEVLRDEATLMAHKAALAGVIVRHELYEDAVHVFQTFPFLEQSRQAFFSARMFVLDVLKPVDADAAVSLQSHAEEKLASEIDTVDARVVRGDGTESSSKKEEICSPKVIVQELRAEATEESPDDDRLSSPEDEPSWISSTPWPSSPQSPEEVDVTAEKKRHEPSRRNTARSTGSTRSTASGRSRASSIGSSLWRMSPFSATPAAPVSPTSSSLRRVRSRPYLKSDSSAAIPPTKEYRLPAQSLTPSTNEPAPRPSIRRSHASHPDITVLCDQWANHGPANRTLTYKPESVGRSRKRAGTISSFTSAAGPSP